MERRARLGPAFSCGSGTIPRLPEMPTPFDGGPISIQRRLSCANASSIGPRRRKGRRFCEAAFSFSIRNMVASVGWWGKERSGICGGQPPHGGRSHAAGWYESYLGGYLIPDRGVYRGVTGRPGDCRDLAAWMAPGGRVPSRNGAHDRRHARASSTSRDVTVCSWSRSSPLLRRAGSRGDAVRRRSSAGAAA